MNKILIGLLSLLVIPSVSIPSANSNRIKHNAHVLKPFEGGAPLEEIKLKEEKVRKNDIEDFSKYYTANLGKILKADNYESSTNIKLQTYQSGWVGDKDNEYVYKEHLLSHTYIFEKSIDVPLTIIERRKVMPENSGVFEVEKNVSVSKTQSTIITNSIKKIKESEDTINTSIKTKAGVELEDILEAGIETNTSLERKFVTSKENYTEIKECIEKNVTYGMLVKHKIDFNNDTKLPKMYSACYRQTYRMGFITEYKHIYNVEEKKQGLLWRDTVWTYTDSGLYSPIGIYMFLIPVSLPYFEFSVYDVDTYGNEKYINYTDNKIYYL